MSAAPSLDLTSSATGAPHWVLPFAASLSEPCQHALPHLDQAGFLPNWTRLMGRLNIINRLEGDEYALSMPHERLLGEALGWAEAGQPEADGKLPWAAWWAEHDGLALDGCMAWGMLSPGHWLMGRDHLTLLDPASLALSEADSRALMEAVRPLFEEDGWTLLWGSPERWYAAHPSLASLPTASLERVIGRNPDVWLNDHPEARILRRLQSEVQMLLYQHPINDARASQGLVTINSFWLSGAGQAPASLNLPHHITVVNELRPSLLGDDMPAWVAAWQHVDATVLAAALARLDAGQDLRLSLCGERHAVTLGPRPPASLSSRLWRALNPLAVAANAPKPSAFLADL